jgi:hypothetical protein
MGGIALNEVRRPLAAQRRVMPVGGRPVRVLAKLFTGQGTINVPSWSPDSWQVASVNYRVVQSVVRP